MFNICSRRGFKAFKELLLRTTLLCCVVVFASLGWGAAHAGDEAPDAFIKRISTEIQELVKNDPALKAGDLQKTSQIVDTKVMPHLNFVRMTASAVGPSWRSATPEQQSKLSSEFKTLLIRTYAGALSQVSDITVNVKPFRGSADDKEVLVRTEIKGKGDPIELDYRLEKTPGEGAGWKIYNLNVLGVWLVETYRSQFAQEINAKGLDGLITTLSERNKSNLKK
jgi:phospholipid transport system substrate-binding protein